MHDRRVSTGSRVRGLALALGVTGAKRASSLADVPTIAEAGVRGYELTSWYGILAPGGTPAAIVKKLNEAIVAAVAMPDLQAQMIAGGSDPLSSSPEEFAQRIRSDVEKYSKLVREFKLQAD